jgi:hypothetical protein
MILFNISRTIKFPLLLVLPKAPASPSRGFQFGGRGGCGHAAADSAPASRPSAGLPEQIRPELTPLAEAIDMPAEQFRPI